MNDQNAAGLELIFNAGTALSIVREVDGRPFVVVPEGFEVNDLTHMLSAPPQNLGTTMLRDAPSFIGFVNRHKLENTDLYYSLSKMAFLAVFDGARPGAPAWERHKAKYDCPLSQEWKAWTAGDKVKMDQENFALFIERNLPDIAQPDAADLLEIVTTLQAKKKVNFVSGLRLSNGANEFTYEEQVEGSAAKGKLQIPEEITLGIPVFENGQAYAVQAKFRYRIQEGRLAMWYELVRPHVIVQDAMEELRADIEAKTGLSALNGGDL